MESRYRATFNFETGKYDVVDLKEDVVLSSWDSYKEAAEVRDNL